jgi:beta-glucanase (GH16 family)
MKLVLACAFLVMASTVNGQTCPSLIWSDEFDGTSLDETNNWTHQLGDGCDIGLCNWGNNELQQYEATSTKVSNGLLTITANREVDPGGQFKYTSSRINSVGKRSFQYGLFEARIKIPTSQGLWPAFWMIGDDISTVGWPACGELDIMENIGREPKVVHGTMHFGPPWPNNKYTGELMSLIGDEKFSDDFHVFGIEKFQDKVRMLVDGVVYMTRTAEDIAPEVWPFNQPFHFILNVAIGGMWPGNPDSTTVFPSMMDVDYVRVYDGVFGDLVGPRSVISGDPSVNYHVSDGLESYQYTWSASTGITIVSGQGSSTITVAFEPYTGFGMISVSATSSECGSSSDRTFYMPVSVSTRDFSFLSSQDGSADHASFLSNSGSLDESVENPMPTDPVGNSPTVFLYQRNVAEQYDLLTLATAAIENPGDYTSGGPSHFRMDVYTTAPTGTSVILQLENSARNELDYPIGRHSRFKATLNGPGWQRLAFEFMDSPDSAETTVDRIALLFAPNTFSDDVYYFDNLDVYSVSEPTTPTSPEAPTSSPSVVPPPNTSAPSNKPSLRSSSPTLSLSSEAPVNDTPSTQQPSADFVPSHLPTYGPWPSSEPPASSIGMPSLTPSSSPSPSINVPTSSVGNFTILSGGDDPEEERVEYLFSTGSWYNGSIPNPIASDSVNESPNVVEYRRSEKSIYDVIFYSILIESVGGGPMQSFDPNEYIPAVNGSSDDVIRRYFEMDVFAPGVAVGTPVQLQLESAISIHSRYEAILGMSSSSIGWQTLRFHCLDFLDPSDIGEVDTIVLLFAPGTFTNDTYYFDNLRSVLASSDGNFPTLRNLPSDAPTSSTLLPNEDFVSIIHYAGNEDNNAPLVFATGDIRFGASNPLPSDSVNPYPYAIEYRRNAQYLYDVVLYSASNNDAILNPSEYSMGTRYFTLDVYAPTAPAGTVVMLQLENSARKDAGYPAGRHSRYQAVINHDDSAASGWQRLQFVFVDSPDGAEAVADQVGLLFAPGTYTTDVFYYDNLMSHLIG